MSEQNRRMKDRPEQERPYEKCLNTGAESLSDGELLAVILRCGVKGCSSLELAWEILQKHPVYKGLAGLHHLDLESLKEIPGVGDVKAIQIICILELSKRLSRTKLEAEQDFSSPEFIASYYMETMRHLDTEKVMLLLIDQRYHLIKEIVLSEGSAHEAIVPIKDLFQKALRYGAECVVLLHNHPSGFPEPSQEDILLTNRVKECGEMIGISLVDHIIIGDQCYVSLKERDII